MNKTKKALTIAFFALNLAVLTVGFAHALDAGRPIAKKMDMDDDCRTSGTTCIVMVRL